MDNGGYYIEMYKSMDSGVPLSEYSVMELIGYYLSEHKSNPLERLNYDLRNNDIPSSKAEKVRIMLLCL